MPSVSIRVSRERTILRGGTQSMQEANPRNQGSFLSGKKSQGRCLKSGWTIQRSLAVSFFKMC